MSKAQPSDDLSPRAVASYLRKHPHFLCRYPELAQQLTVSHEQGKVISLASYQIQQLRKKVTKLEASLADLRQIAANNEVLVQQVHQLNLNLLNASDPMQGMQQMLFRLHSDFHIEQICLLLFDQHLHLQAEDWLSIPDGIHALPEFADVLSAGYEPVTGRFKPDQLRCLFAKHATGIGSAALIPLGDLGLLALASTEADRFPPGMGTVFLKMIAVTVTAVLTLIQELPVREYG